MGEATKGQVKLPRDGTPNPKPKNGTICPWMREASAASGRQLTLKQMACTPDCAKFGLYFPSGRIEKALGCRRGLR